MGVSLAAAAARVGIPERTIRRQRRRVRGLQQVDWAPALAVAPREQRPTPAWATPLLRLWRRPSRPALADVLDQLRPGLPAGVVPPSYGQARRYLQGLSSVERARGRLGPNALKGVKSFVRRTVEGLEPGDVFIADGHTFDAEVMHPKGGQPCRPEITSVLDVATRRWVGWSVALAESTWAVADALRHAVETGGVPAIYYADRGAGQDNAVLDQMLGRLGITRERSIARNSQARGVIEAFNKQLIKVVKRLPSYMGADMDGDAKRIVHLRSRSELRTIGTSALLLPWAKFVEIISEAHASYNARPHRSLGGRSPDQAWQAAVDAGWRPALLDQAELDDLFRPYELRVTRRGEVSLHGKRYFARPLEHLDGAEVLVGYDIHDPARVWVRDLEDRLVAIAGLDANAQPYFPTSRLEQARSARAKGRLRRLDAKRDRVFAEIDGQAPEIEGAAEASGRIDGRPAEGSVISMPARKEAERGKAFYLKIGALFAAEITGQRTLTEQESALVKRGLRSLLERETRRYAKRHRERLGNAPGEVVALPAGAQAADDALPYEVVEFTGTEDDAFFARARFLERRQAAGETLDARDARWLAGAQGEAWYATCAHMEAWHTRLAARRM